MFLNLTHYEITLKDSRGNSLVLEKCESPVYLTYDKVPTNMYTIDNTKMCFGPSCDLTQEAVSAYPITDAKNIKLSNELPPEKDGVKYIVYTDVAMYLLLKKIRYDVFCVDYNDFMEHVSNESIVSLEYAFP